MANKSIIQQARDLFNNIGQGVNNYKNYLGQEAQRLTSSQFLNAPIVNSSTPAWSKPILQPFEDYTKNQIQAPITQGVNQIRQPGAGGKAMGALQVGQGVFSATPAGAGFNVLSGAAAGAARAVRTGANPVSSVYQGITQPTSFATAGLGINNPYLAMPIDLLINRNPKNIPQDLKAIAQNPSNIGKVLDTAKFALNQRPGKDLVQLPSAFKDVSPNALAIHPEDQKALIDIVGKIQGKIPLTKDEAYNLQILADHYLGKKYSASTTGSIAKAFDFFLAKQGGGIPGKLPRANYLTNPNEVKTVDQNPTYYHGTTEGFNGNLQTGQQVGKGEARNMVYLSESPATAKGYAQLRSNGKSGQVLPYKINGKVLDQSSKVLQHEVSTWDLSQLTPKEQRYVQNYLAQGRLTVDQLESAPNLQKLMKEKGYVGFSESDYTSNKSKQVAIFDPSALTSPSEAQPGTPVIAKSTGLPQTEGQIPGRLPRASYLAGENSITSEKPVLGQPLTPPTEQPQLGLQPQTGNPLNPGASGSTMNPTTAIPSTEQYIKELIQKQQQAGSSGNVGFGQRIGNFLSDIKAKLVDETAPIQDILTSAEKKNKFQVLPKADIRLQIDRVLRSKNLASQFAEDNGLVDAIKKAPDINALDQYMIAKQAARVESQGIRTGRNLARDQQMITDLAPQYEGIAQQVNQYSRKLLDYSVQTGLIDKNLANQLIQKYPEYVPLNRVFSELEQATNRGTGKGVASLSKQTVVQRLQGSERQIQSPIESLLLKTQDAFSQGERNVAAKQLASYQNLPGFEGLIKQVDPGSRAPHTFSFIDNGVKKTFATTPAIEAAAKSLNVEQMGILGKILSVPTRVLQLGATGLNVPFVATNMLKDEITGFINSNKAASTSILNPVNYVKSVFAAVGHDQLYKDMVRAGGGGTSFDIARQAPNLAVAKIRNPIKYTVTHPIELLRAVENIVGRSEEFGRVKNYAGTKGALLKQGRTLQDATLLAGKAARENTANFARRGSFGRVINWVIPFFNAGIQGSRQLVRSFQNAPAQTSAKVAATIFTPIAVTTAWNLSDPQRKQIYQDIPAYEKENNLILIPPNPSQDSQGRWNVIKIPLPPGLSNLGTLVRRSMETASGLDPIKFGEIAANLITAGTSVDVTSPNKLASTFTPQAVKPVVEATTNTNLFTGQKIVPDYMKNQPPEFQTKPGVSGIATGIGKALNVSPLMVENFAQSQLGGLGSQLLGKESVAGNLERRFSKAAGGNQLDKVYNDSTKLQAIESQVKKLADAGQRDQAIKLIQQNKAFLSQAIKVKPIRSEVDKLQEAKNKVKADTRLTPEQKTKVLNLIQKKLYELSTLYSARQKQ